MEKYMGSVQLQHVANEYQQSSNKLLELEDHLYGTKLMHMAEGGSEELQYRIWKLGVSLYRVLW